MWRLPAYTSDNREFSTAQAAEFAMDWRVDDMADARTVLAELLTALHDNGHLRDDQMPTLFAHMFERAE